MSRLSAALLAVGVVAMCAAAVAAQAGAPSCPRNGGIISQPGTPCVWESDAFYNGTVVQDGREAPQESALACCELCGTNPECNVWAWCGNEGGCCAKKEGCVAADLAQAPFGSCTLKFQEGLTFPAQSPAPEYIYNASDVAAWADGAATALASGVNLPDIIPGEEVPGFEALPGQDLRTGNYLCEESLYVGRIIGGCRLNGTVTELAAGCAADPECTGFSYQPYGCCSSDTDSQVEESGWRKTGAIDDACTYLLPHTTFYVLSDRSAAST